MKERTKAKLSKSIRDSVHEFIVNNIQDVVDEALTIQEAADQICDRIYGLKRLTKDRKEM